MLDKATVKRGRTPETLLATFDLGGRLVVLEITANSVKSPFHLPEASAFTCPGIS